MVCLFRRMGAKEGLKKRGEIQKGRERYEDR